ncbi:hypothetical protein BDY24DRAFT_402531 [Mrakia frigida]|uniref:uncharacterized protein n=1 Tax=Mrakia frigida TaxID=29902 RepID=UPI003FCC0E7B
MLQSHQNNNLPMSQPTPPPHQVPKAILYWNPSSVWSTVPRLALLEKGYNESDVILKEVDISKGDNFSPSYLRINQHGTIPTLVVPVLETTSDDMETRYRSFKDTMSILTFLDSSRTSASNSHASPSSQARPAPTLSPATMEGKTLSDALTLSVHLSSADPNFLLLSARTSHELVLKEAGFPGRWIKMRQEALLRFTDLLEEGSQGRIFLQKKLDANSILFDIYYSPSGPETEARRKVFFAASQKAWSVGVVEVLKTLEEEMVGVYALGDQVSLADLHLIAWLARVVFLSQGGPTSAGLDALERQIAGHGAGGPTDQASLKVGPKVKAFWNSWIGRDSFKSVYVNGLH